MSLCDSIQFHKRKNAILFYMRKTEINYFFWRLIEQDLATSNLWFKLTPNLRVQKVVLDVLWRASDNIWLNILITKQG